MDKSKLLISFVFCMPLVCCLSTTRPGFKSPNSPVIWNEPEPSQEPFNSYEEAQFREEEAKHALMNDRANCPNFCVDQPENGDRDVPTDEPTKSEELTSLTENSENLQQTVSNDNDLFEFSSVPSTPVPTSTAEAPITKQPIESARLEQLSIENVTGSATPDQTSELVISTQVPEITEVRPLINESAPNHESPLSTSTTPSTPTTTEPLRPFEKQRYTVTIMLIGRSGSGVSSTIRELAGPYTKCTKPAEKDSFTKIYKYTISDIPHSTRDYKIKLIDMPGLVDGRTVSEDAQILATFKSYLQQYEIPDMFLVLSKFDDNRIDGAHSLLVKFLKKLELFESLIAIPLPKFAFAKSTLFLLTHFMSSSKQTQRRPDAKINQFKKVISEYTSSFPSPHITVGENKAEVDYGARIQGGYYVLPNREHYPKNLWQSLANVSSSAVHSDIFATLMNNREVKMTCAATLIPLNWDFYEQDVQAFTSILQKDSINVTNTPVNTAIQEFFDEADEDTRLEGIVQKTALQLYLQDNSFISSSDFPLSEQDIATFFQESKLSGFGTYFLSNLFDIVMPVYSKPVVVGQGYDLLKAQVLAKTPFKTGETEPTPLGYQLPRFLNCRKNIIQDKQTMRSYSESQLEYNKQRLKHLEFDWKENITRDSSWKWGARDGFNLQPDVGSEKSMVLSIIREARSCKCVLKQDTQDLVTSLAAHFPAAIFKLPVPFNETRVDHVKQWRKFFETYGTHVVSKAFGGGYLRGRLQINNLDRVWPDLENQVEKVLINLVRFNGTYPVTNLGSPEYRFFGGNRDTRTSDLHYLSKETRDKTLDAWYSSLESDFIMMDNTLGLEPISSIVNITINPEMGHEVHQVLSKLLNGELGRNISAISTTLTSPPSFPIPTVTSGLGGHHNLMGHSTPKPTTTSSSGISAAPTSGSNPVDAFETFFGSGFESGNFYVSLGKPKPKKPAASSPDAAEAATMKNLKAQFDSTQQALDLAYKRIADMEEEDKEHQRHLMAQRASEVDSSHQMQVAIIEQVEKEAAERFRRLRENLHIMYTNEIELARCTGLRSFFNACTFTYIGKNKPKPNSRQSKSHAKVNISPASSRIQSRARDDVDLTDY